MVDHKITAELEKDLGILGIGEREELRESRERDKSLSFHLNKDHYLQAVSSTLWATYHLDGSLSYFLAVWGVPNWGSPSFYQIVSEILWKLISQIVFCSLK